ncbi:MAG: tetratricopeptide repeat protein [Bryobacteraceae bacterium]
MTLTSSRGNASAPSLGASGRLWLPYLILVLLVVAIYARVAGYQYVDFDDDILVAQNPWVNSGLTVGSLKWAFTTFNLFWWQPVLWISFLVDVQFFGTGPGPHHIVNVALHAANSVLLLAFLRYTTGSLWRSFFAAILFAVHPLRVESVAWISERKDVLSGFFCMLTLLAYSRYCRKGAVSDHFLLLVTFSLGLMAKPILMTMPVLMLLLDYWPLRRWTRVRQGWPLFLEKVPLLVLSALSFIMTATGLHQAGAIVSVPWSTRIGNAVFAYAKYLFLLLWPAHLSVLYPYRLHIPLPELAAAAIMLAAISWIVIRCAPRKPYLLAGWLWYVVALAPTVGLLQSGSQAFADRYTYLPSIGILVAVVWILADMLPTEAFWRLPASACAVLVVVLFAVASRIQVSAWQNSVTLFSQAAAVAPTSALVHHNLGYGLAEQGRYREAIPHYLVSLSLDPGLERVHYNLGRALYEEGRLEDSIGHFLQELKSDQASDREPDVRTALGIALTRTGRVEEARREFLSALKSRPQSAEFHANWGSFLARTGELEAAAREFQAAIQLNPAYTEARLNLGHALASLGRPSEALQQFRAVLRRSPGNVDAAMQIDAIAHGNQ